VPLRWKVRAITTWQLEMTSRRSSRLLLLLLPLLLLLFLLLFRAEGLAVDGVGVVDWARKGTSGAAPSRHAIQLDVRLL